MTLTGQRCPVCGTRWLMKIGEKENMHTFVGVIIVVPVALIVLTLVITLVRKCMEDSEEDKAVWALKPKCSQCGNLYIVREWTEDGHIKWACPAHNISAPATARHLLPGRPSSPVERARDGPPW